MERVLIVLLDGCLDLLLQGVMQADLTLEEKAELVSALQVRPPQLS